MSNHETTTAPIPFNASTERVRRHRERRREGLCSFTVDMPKADIEDAVARGKLKSDYDAWSVLDAYYADHLSDAALDWLVNNRLSKTRIATMPGRSYAAFVAKAMAADWHREDSRHELIVIPLERFVWA